MSYQNYKKAVELIEKNSNILVKTYPQHESEIVKAENILGVKFPKSYREFLKQYGIFDINASEIYGLDYSNLDIYLYYNTICNTLDERKINEDPKFPKSFVVVYDLGNGEKFCLDTARMDEEGECPIVCWSFGNVESIDDDFGKDFGEFFLNVLVKGLQRLEREGEKVNW